MKTRYLLQLDAQQLIIQRWQQADLQELACFSPNEQGRADFQSWLQAHPGLPFSLLVNLAEEGFQVETLPHLGSRERQVVLERRFKQHFFGTPLTLAQSLGYQKAQRREERVLLAALTQPSSLEPWLHTLQTCHTPLLGLFSQHQLTGELCRRLALPLDHCLVLTRHAQGLRQSLVMQGETVFSRLTPLADSQIASEVQKLHQYLSSQQLINWEAPLTVCHLTHPLSHHDLQASGLDQGVWHFRTVDICSAATKLGLKTQLTSSLADPLLLHLLATRPPRWQFAPAALRQSYLQARLQRGLLLGAGTILLTGLLLMGTELLSARHLQAETSHVRRQGDALQAEYERLSPRIPGLELDQEQVQALLARHEQIASQQQTPAPILTTLSQGLSMVPGIKLEKLHWQGEKDGSSLSVEGSLPASDPQQQARDFAQLLAALNQPDIALQVIRHPVETAPDKPLRGGDLEVATHQSPTLSLRLRLQTGGRL